jgi:5'-nucleotidase
VKILLTNDDGFEARGINVLFDTLKEDFDVTMVAPESERSTTGHSLSLDQPLRVSKVKEKIYAVTGFPADCVYWALGTIFQHEQPDLVLSGINHGANLGQDIYYSGTVAGAREGVFHGYRGMAVSLVHYSPKESYFETAANFVLKQLKNNIHQNIQPSHMININVPNLPANKIKGVEVTTMGLRHYSNEIHERDDARGRKYYWVAGTYRGFKDLPGSDCLAIDQDKISITPLNIFPQASDLFQNYKF